jgi:hypothetical protein
MAARVAGLVVLPRPAGERRAVTGESAESVRGADGGGDGHAARIGDACAGVYGGGEGAGDEEKTAHGNGGVLRVVLPVREGGASGAWRHSCVDGRR